MTHEKIQAIAPGNHLSVAEIAHHLSCNLTEQKKLTETDPLLHRAEQICKWKNGATQRRWALVEADQLARQSAETCK